jgi:UDP-N-acetylmuramoylalanine--D-glutamate ligase
MKLSEVVGLRVAVWGAGREGREALRVLGPANDVSLVVDDPDDGARRLAADAGVPLHPATVEQLLDVDVIVRSPGVSRYRSELVATRSAGVEDTGLIALWLAERGPAGTIGVTGTKGKSTTSWLCRALLEAAGHPAALAGNIGVPVTMVDAAAPIVVVEVSSYQAADVVTSPAVGVLTSLGEDHLPWHGSIEQYHADKLNLFAHTGLRHLVVEAADATAVAATAGRAERVLTGSARWHLAGSALVADGERLDLGDVLGRAHYALDALLAVTAVESLLGAPLPSAAISAVADGFTGLPARQQLVGSHHGVRYIDDALASNPAATLAAVHAFATGATAPPAGPPLVLILGGADRGVDHAELLAAMPGKVAATVLLSETGRRWAPAVSRLGIPTVLLDTDDIAAAVAAAARLAEPGAIVLFSPAAPTPPSVGTYEQRSTRFAEAVAALG